MAICLIFVAFYAFHSEIHVFVVLQQEYVLQPDGTVTPLNNVQNYVLSEQQAGEILAQVF